MLLAEFLNLCIKTRKMGNEVTFGVAYIQEQFGIAETIFEKTIKNKLTKSMSSAERGSVKTRHNDLTEFLPQESLIEAENLNQNSKLSRGGNHSKSTKPQLSS